MNDDRLLQQLKAFGVWAASMRSLATFTDTLTLLSEARCNEGTFALTSPDDEL